MPEPDRNGAFVLGLFVGLGIVLNLFLWLDYHSLGEVSSLEGVDASSEISPIGAFWSKKIVTFVSAKDTLAQWIVTLTTVIGTTILILTLRVANKTNDAAVSAAREARETNKLVANDQRPWLTFEVTDWGMLQASIMANRPMISLGPKVSIVNRGRGPAQDVRLGFEVVECRSIEIEGRGCSIAQNIHSSPLRSGTMVFPGEEREVQNGTSIDLSFDSKIPSDEAKDGNKMTWWFIVVLYYSSNGIMHYTRKVYALDPPWAGASLTTEVHRIEKIEPVQILMKNRYV